MKPTELVYESVMSALRRATPTIMIVLLVAVACSATILTVGRTTAAEDQIRARLDSAGARLVDVQDVSGSNLITSGSVAVLAKFSTIERALALSLPTDANTGAQGPGGSKIPIWEYRGTPATALRVTQGRLPGPGEAAISTAAARIAGLDAPIGAVISGTRSWSVVGFYAARAPFTDLDRGIVAPASASTDTPLLYVVSRAAADVQKVADQTRDVLDPPDAGDLTFSVPNTLAELQAAVGTDLGGLGRSLLLMILGGGSILVALVVFADTLVRRNDLGRRRALGMARTEVVAFILLRTAASAAAGALLGCVSGDVYLSVVGAAPPSMFTVATGLLAVIAAAVAAAPPVLAAAFADPIRVLRTP